MTYPFKASIRNSEHIFKIEKIDSDINLRLLTDYRSFFFKNIYLNSCLNPTYILIRNPSLDEYSTNNDLFYFKSIVHSGEFYGSYKTNDYSPKNDGSLLNSFTNFNLTELTLLPNKFFFIVLELECNIPGMLTIAFYGNTLAETPSEILGGYFAFENKGVTLNRFNYSHELYLSTPINTGT